jgi:uncharacterized membrane protein
MTWIQLTKIYCLTLLVFLIIDFIWLGIIAKGFYSRHLGHLMKDSVNWTAAILFYLVFIAGMLVFVIQPAAAAQNAMRALWLGMFYGLVTYATFDLTSLALLKGWSTPIVVVDIIWGIVISGLVSSAGYQIAEWIS